MIDGTSSLWYLKLVSYRLSCEQLSAYQGFCSTQFVAVCCALPIKPNCCSYKHNYWIWSVLRKPHNAHFILLLIKKSEIPTICYLLYTKLCDALTTSLYLRKITQNSVIPRSTQGNHILTYQPTLQRHSGSTFHWTYKLWTWKVLKR